MMTFEQGDVVLVSFPFTDLNPGTQAEVLDIKMESNRPIVAADTYLKL